MAASARTMTDRQGVAGSSRPVLPLPVAGRRALRGLARAAGEADVDERQDDGDDDDADDAEDGERGVADQPGPLTGAARIPAPASGVGVAARAIEAMASVNVAAAAMAVAMVVRRRIM